MPKKRKKKIGTYLYPTLIVGAVTVAGLLFWKNFWDFYFFNEKVMRAVIGDC